MYVDGWKSDNGKAEYVNEAKSAIDTEECMPQRIPRSLKISSTENVSPNEDRQSLSNLRTMLRKNMFFHKDFNPVLSDKEH